MEEGNYTYEDIVRVKYKMNKKGRKVTCKLPNGVVPKEATASIVFTRITN
jgi:hypothetical protein